MSRWCEENNVLPESLTLGRRSLEDVFLDLTGGLQLSEGVEHV